LRSTDSPEIPIVNKNMHREITNNVMQYLKEPELWGFAPSRALAGVGVRLNNTDGPSKCSMREKSLSFRAHLRGPMSGIFQTEFNLFGFPCLTEGDEVCSFRIAVQESAPARAARKPPDTKPWPRV
jgi:hypothetical protein